MIIYNAALGGGSYANWNQSSENLVASDTLFVCLADGGLGVSDDGSGLGLIAPNLTLTQANNIPAATGGYRQLTAGSSQRFTGTQTWAEAIFVGTTWSVVQKWSDWTALGANNGLFNVENVGGNSNIRIAGEAADKMNAIVRSVGGGVALSATTTNTFPTSGAVYVFVGCDGTTTYAGFTQSGSGASGQPTLWADFAANDRVSNVATPGAYPGGELDTYWQIGSYEVVNYCTAKLAWTIGSTEFLLTI